MSRAGLVVSPMVSVIVTAAPGAGPVRAADSPVGKWKTVDDKSGKVVSDVEVYEQGGKLFGKITRLTEPNTPQGTPKTCTKCPGADKDRPIVGLVILRDLSTASSKCAGTSAPSTRRRPG
jgi:uncharacterized protein (DUF2147 family)